MPSSSREAFFALRAFNVEIASIKDSSQLIGGRARGSRSADMFEAGAMDLGGAGDSGSLASKLRMQWWRDSISEIYDVGREDPSRQLSSSIRHNPTLRSLSQAIHGHGLTQRFLRRIMEAREADLEVMQYDRVRDMAQYGEDTVSNVLYLSLECVGVSVFPEK